MLQHIRQVTPSRFGGIIVPFGQYDKHRTRFTKATNFYLGQYRLKPAFVHHNLRGHPGLVGVFDDNAFRVTDEGLYGEFDLVESGDHFDQEAVNEFLRMQRTQTAFFSSGSEPHRVRKLADGTITDWPIVSVGITDTPSAVGGMTRVGHLRGYYENFGAEGQDDQALAEWPNGGLLENMPDSLPPAPPQPANWQGVMESINQRFMGLETHLRASLPAGMPAPLRPRSTIHVASKWDKYNLGQLAMLGWLRQEAPRLRYNDLEPLADDFYRAAVDKLGAAYAEDEAKSKTLLESGGVPEWMREFQRAQEIPGWGQGLPEHLRAVPRDVYDQWTQMAPHLRSDETQATATANQGAEWVPTLMNAAVWHTIVGAANVLPLFEVFDMPSNPFDYPVLAPPATPMKRVVEATDAAHGEVGGSNVPAFVITSSKKTFDAHGFGGQILISKEMLEDSGFDFLAAQYEAFTKYFAWTMDYLLIQGDETADTTNQGHVGEAPAATAYNGLLNMDGLKHEPLITTSTDKAAQTAISADTITALRELMGSNGVLGLDPSKLVVIMDSKVYYDYLVLDALQTLDKFGDRATVLTGSIMALDGCPVVAPGSAYELSNASGQVEDSHDSALGSYMVCYRPGIKIGRRRSLDLSVNRDWSSTLSSLMGTARFDVQFMQTGTVALGYNVGGS